MSQPTVIDVRAELEATITRDVNIDDPSYRRLPPADPQFPDVFAHNDSTAGLAETWHVSCAIDFYDADADDALALAEALTKAARQAMILNAPSAVSVLRPMIGSEVYAELADRPVARLVLGVEPTGRELASFGRAHHPDTAAPGSVWCSDGLSFEHVGSFRYVGTDIRDGASRVLLVGVGAPTFAGAH